MNKKVEVELSDGTSSEEEYLYMQQIKNLIAEILPIINIMKDGHSLEVIASAFVNVAVMLVLDSGIDKDLFVSKVSDTWDSFSGQFKELIESRVKENTDE